MFEEQQAQIEAAAAKARRIGLVASLVLLLAAIAGIALIVRFAALEAGRDLRAWQAQLGLVADSRAAAVDEWLARQWAVLRELAENASLQLYMTELALAGGARTGVTEEPAQAAYLRHLLQASAERSGFAPAREAASVPANVARAGTAGIALVGPDHRPLAASAGMPPLDGELGARLRQREAGRAMLIDIFAGADGSPAIGFVQPVHAVQVQGVPREIGYLVGVRPAGEELQRRLAQPGETARSAETLLVRGEPGGLLILSRLADGTPPLSRRIARGTPDSAELFALENPGGFGTGIDHAGQAVLVASRALAEAPWILVRKIGRAEALAESELRVRALLWSGIGAVLLLALLIFAVWRHGSSRRAAQAAERFRLLAERFGGLSRFMRLVTDGQPTAIQALGADGKVRFANRQAAALAGIAADDMIGKDLASLLGPGRAAELERLNRLAIASGERQTSTQVMPIAGEERMVRTEHLPLPADAADGEPGGVLLVIEDITELVRERDRRERTLDRLVRTLVELVDRRDPYAAHHSERVAEVAGALAGEMELDRTERETVRIAAALMNVGKIGVPSALLVKDTPLSEEEMRRVRESVMASAELLDGIEFDGPVVETLRQLREHWDGSGGPRGLAGEAILLPARIVAVANAFVGMISNRAWRAGLGLDEAAQELLKEAGRRYDRRPVVALVNILENRGGRERWQAFREPPQAGA
ncbi:MAG: PAS domain-containing protein [Alphaproteobacteria bacterium]|nr:PAS domain-containing protein [Alphaproteobacteria bacterium]